MRLDLSTWQEIETYLERSAGIIIPTGSTEQHGPMGLIGTDTICANEIALRAGEKVGALVTPPLWLTPAPFNLAFPGSLSITAELFQAVVAELISGLSDQGFRRFFVLNGHGANLQPLKSIADERGDLMVRSWWDFEPVNDLRRAYYGDWEGMHATPSEVAITQAIYRTVPPGDAATPPTKLTAEFISAHAGDRHGPPDEHRRQFPDGRVGSHSALATPEHGKELLDTAVIAVAECYATFVAGTGVADPGNS